VKTLDDIQQDMSDLYESLKTGNLEIKVASELANIAGKFLKAEQLKLAKEIFTYHRSRGALTPPAPGETQGSALAVLQQ
jgi:hypothetical protein